MMLRLSVLSILIVFVSTPAFAQDSADKVYESVVALQKAGKHAKALKLLEGKAKVHKWGHDALGLKAISLNGTGKAGDAFDILAKLRTSTSKYNRVMNEIGMTLPAQVVKVKSTPAGATFKIKDHTGTTPSEIKLHPGSYSAMMTLDGHADWRQPIFIARDQAGYLSAELKSTSGALTVVVDTSGLTATVAGKKVPLKVGSNQIANVPAGIHTVTFHNAKGVQVHQLSVTVAGGSTATASYRTMGTVRSKYKDATVQVDSDEDTTKSPRLELAEGNYSLILRRPARYPVKGQLGVKAGQDIVLTNELASVPDRRGMEIGAIVGLSVGLTAVAAATVMELADIGESGGLDATKFALAGVGGAAFVAGGVLLKWVREEKSDPTPKDGQFQIQLGASPLPKGAMVGASGRF